MASTRRFLVDGMLGSLTRWLRICGYDTLYVRDAVDEALIGEARRGGRTLLTGDKLLYRKASKAGLEALLVEGGSAVERLALVAARFDLSLDPEMSRCPSCGAALEKVDEGELRGKVPDKSLEAYDEFWTCASCGKAYWRGSHWENIQETISEASRRACALSRPSYHAL
jgi:uncharacterized protein with PIN domain